MSLRLPTATLDRSGPRPVWVYTDGTVLPYIAGGAPEDDETPDDDQSSEDDDPSGDEDEAESAEDGDGDEEEGDVKSLKAKITALESEKARHYKKRKAAEQRVTELETEIQNLKAGKSNDDPEAAEQLKTLTETNATLESALQNLTIENAFLTTDTANWKSPKAARTALKLANLDDVEIDDDGTVHGLEEALRAVAEEHDYLVADSSSGSGAVAAGKASNGRNKPGAKSVSRESLARKYPGLRR